MLEPGQIDAKMARPDAAEEGNFALLREARRLCDAASVLGKRQEKYDAAPASASVTISDILDKLRADISIVNSMLDQASERIHVEPAACGNGPDTDATDIVSKLRDLVNLVSHADDRARQIANAL